MSNHQPWHRSARITPVLALGLGLAIAASSTTEAQDVADPTLVRVREGAVQGAIEDGLAVFRGMPYAAPPVGTKRWKPPQPAEAWQGVRDATAFGPPCPMMDGRRMAEGRWISTEVGDVFVDIPTAPGSSEDCLHLNVWAPADAEQAAVMVFLQPTYASSFPLFDGAAFARDGVVFVSLDYRQLTFGNFAHPALTAEAEPDESLARFQTMDQMAALRWVKENIAAFGGDPNNVTVFGQSAGGHSVLQLLTIPDARGLIDKAIVQSGGGWSMPWSLSQMERLGAVLATYAGLPGEDATAEQLRALPPDSLPQVGVYSIDGRLQLEGVTSAIDAERMADVPLLIGWTDFDGSSLRSAKPEDVVARASAPLSAAYATEGLAGADLGYRMYTDEHVGAPARWVARKASNGAPSYLYLFSYVLSGNRANVRGASHGSELPFVFDIWDKALPQLRLSEEDRAATRTVHSCWVSFAKTGTPSCDGAPAWPAYTAESDQLMELGVKPQVISGFRRRQLDAQERAWREGNRESAQTIEDALRGFEESRLQSLLVE